MGIGKPINRQDAYEKVTGTAKYVEDMIPAGAYIAKILRSTIANGLVTSLDASDALKLAGVIKIVTCFDVPDIGYSTAGHPYSLDPEHRDIKDKRILNKRIRYYGDEIAVVVARDELTARKALGLIKVTYDEYTPYLSTADACSEGARLIHEEFPENRMAELSYSVSDGTLGMNVHDRDYLEKIREKFKSKNTGAVGQDETEVMDVFELPAVHASHIENVGSLAYMEGKRITIVSTTQVPHIARHIVSDAIGYPMGDIRVIKPYLGGGFGNKQDIYLEPLAAYLTTVLGGHAVAVILSREETFIGTRTRHAMRIWADQIYKDGDFAERNLYLDSNQGAYSAHGHAIAANAATNFHHLYPNNNGKTEVYSRSIYTNLPSGAAMRGYGIPQITFVMEAQMDELANKLGCDPIELRKKHMMNLGFVDPFEKIPCLSNGLEECIERGKEIIGWDQKREEYSKSNTGHLRRGVGMAIFAYKTGVAPITAETAACRIILNQNGSIQVQVGATEIGQGSDTAFSQMASEILRIPTDKIHVISTQDTDVTPFDSGAYASRQSYITGGTVKATAILLKDKILAHAGEMFGISATSLDLDDEKIIETDSKKVICTIEDVSMHSLYKKENSQHITAELTRSTLDNAFSFGACFADVEVDIPIGKIKINRILNVHDSGKLINPKLALAQIHGGVGMGIGYAIGEQLLFDKNTGEPLNNNFLDYKIPTSMDIPDIEGAFVETFEPTGPFGNKALGEPPLIPVAPAIRNAVYHATGVAITSLPMNPEKLINAFIADGLLPKI